MLTVGVSTSSPASSIAIMEDGCIVGEDAFEGARSCVEELIPRLKKLLADQGRGMRDIGKLAVDVGPGGLTGLKIGVVAVKTIAQALDIPVVPVSSMRALCHGLDTETEYIMPLMRSTKKEFFSAIYRKKQGGVECIEQERLDTPEGLAGRLADFAGAEITVAGDGAGQAAEVLESEKNVTIKMCVDDKMKYPTARLVCRIAGSETGRHWREINPRYLCLTNAERNFGIRV